MNHWSSYSSGYRIKETAKYIISQLADTTCLNRIDKVGATALRMACASGNLEVCQALIAAGHDVNLALGYSPLTNAKSWLVQCKNRERAATRGADGGEKRLAQMLRIRAEQTVELLESNGAVERGVFEAMANTRDYIMSGQYQSPSSEVGVSPTRNLTNDIC
jgi:ankyrin repeat protein